MFVLRVAVPLGRRGIISLRNKQEKTSEGFLMITHLQHLYTDVGKLLTGLMRRIIRGRRKAKDGGRKQRKRGGKEKMSHLDVCMSLCSFGGTLEAVLSLWTCFGQVLTAVVAWSKTCTGVSPLLAKRPSTPNSSVCNSHQSYLIETCCLYSEM